VDQLPDPRDLDLITYSTRHLVYLALVMILSHSRSRRQFGFDSSSPEFRRNFEGFAGEECALVAVPDTINAMLRRMPDEEGLALLPGKMTSWLIAQRVLERHRFEGEYLLAIDGTRLCSFPERHCDQCLKACHSNGSVSYFHAVLEAKIVSKEGPVFSLASVFIQNSENGIYDKQDCELKAFYRLAPILKKRFPRLPLCLLMDSLYANDPVLELCRANGWSYCLAFKEGSIPTLYQEMLKRFERHPANGLTLIDDDATETYEWACNLKYNSHDLHAIRCSIEPTNEAEETTRFVFLTDHRPDEDTVRTIANCGGRQRSKIENQGFNVQKNHGYRLVKGYGYQGFAYKNFYYITQIAHTIHQLIAYGDLNAKLAAPKTHAAYPAAAKAFLAVLIQEARRAIDAFGSISAIAQSIGKTMRYRILDQTAFDPDYARRIQIRFPVPDT
jgi:hypothetical protein